MHKSLEETHESLEGIDKSAEGMHESLSDCNVITCCLSALPKLPCQGAQYLPQIFTQGVAVGLK